MKAQPNDADVIEKKPFDGKFYPELIGQDLHKRYPFECPVCEAKLDAAPSLLMTLGCNTGGGSCTKCDTLLSLEVDKYNEKMIAKEWKPKTKKGDE